MTEPDHHHEPGNDPSEWTGGFKLRELSNGNKLITLPPMRNLDQICGFVNYAQGEPPETTQKIIDIIDYCTPYCRIELGKKLDFKLAFKTHTIDIMTGETLKLPDTEGADARADMPGLSIMFNTSYFLKGGYAATFKMGKPICLEKNHEGKVISIAEASCKAYLYFPSGPESLPDGFSQLTHNGEVNEITTRNLVKFHFGLVPEKAQ